MGQTYETNISGNERLGPVIFDVFQTGTEKTDEFDPWHSLKNTPVPDFPCIHKQFFACSSWVR